jgi:hypothetical protein
MMYEVRKSDKQINKTNNCPLSIKKARHCDERSDEAIQNSRKS